MTRTPLPDRRRGLSVDFDHPTGRYTVTCGFNQAGFISEIFVTGAKYGSEMQTLMADAGIVISRLLQHGEPIEILIKALEPKPDDTGRPMPSIILAAIRAIAEAASG
jgi:hypothetical protein